MIPFSKLIRFLLFMGGFRKRQENKLSCNDTCTRPRSLCRGAMSCAGDINAGKRGWRGIMTAHYRSYDIGCNPARHQFCLSPPPPSPPPPVKPPQFLCNPGFAHTNPDLYLVLLMKENCHPQVPTNNCGPFTSISIARNVPSNIIRLGQKPSVLKILEKGTLR